MSRPCSVCRDERRRSIDGELLGGASIRAVAGHFSIARSTLAGHVRHIQDTFRAAQETAEHGRVLDVALLLTSVNSAAMDALRTARGSGDVRAQLMACSTVLRQCEFAHALEVDARTEELWHRVEVLEQLLGQRNGVAHQ